MSISDPTAFKGSSWNLLENCLFIAEGQVRRSLLPEIVLYLATASSTSSSKQICPQIQLIARNRRLLIFIFFLIILKLCFIDNF